MTDEELELIPDLVEDETEEIKYKEYKKPVIDLSGAIIEEDKDKRVPITIITGYLGSGKSTLLDQIAKKGDRKIAVILNEFGDSIDIEKSLTIKDKDNKEVEEWLDLGNGCLCCTVKDNGVAAIERLVAKRKGFDHIILETTGLADPGPIINMFWLDDGLLSNVYIDGVITVLDVTNIEKCLNDKDDDHHGGAGDDLTIANVQIALADVIILNKVDLIKDDSLKLKRVKDTIRSINNNVPMFETQFGAISLDKILDLHAYEAKDINELVKNIDSESFAHDHRMGTVSFNFRKLSSDKEFSKFERFLQELLWNEEYEKMEIHRTKGLIFVNDGYKVIQGVRKTYDIIDGIQPISEVKLTESRLVVIGKYIDSKLIDNKFFKEMGFNFN